MTEIAQNGNLAATGGLTGAESEALLSWLIQRQVSPMRITLLFDSFCRKLRSLGVPLDRGNLAIPQLNPRLRSRTFHWSREAGGAVEVGRQHGIDQQPNFIHSPIKAILEGGEMIRRHITGPDVKFDYPILEDLQAQGFTDYLACPVVFSDKQINVLTLATKDEDGFQETQIRLLTAALPVLAAVAEIRNRRTTAEELLDTYIGRQSGQQVLAGTIKRGDGEVIHAVLWSCDLANFTALSEQEDLSEVIALLNDYFEAVGRPIADRGGEILKFIGDALLAIFPVPEDITSYRTVCATALEAAEQAMENMVALNRQRSAAGRPPLKFGMALHVGDVMFGNIGTADRLDFTVIGPAVNLVSRIEALSRDYEPPIVASRAFAEQSGATLTSIGQHRLKGIAEAQEVFRLEASPG